MIVLRPIAPKDLDAYEAMAMEAALGMTSLPKNRHRLEQRIDRSMAAFSKETAPFGSELYLFVAEDVDTGTIVGTTALQAAIDPHEPKYYYQRVEVETVCPILHSPLTYSLLEPVVYREGSTEVCGLFLLHPYRHLGLGTLLTRSRYLFMAAHPNRFKDPIFADLRGYIDDRGHSPFWTHVGRHFCHASFDQVLTVLNDEREFMEGLLPSYPLYVSLLPTEAQQAIGQTHPRTRPAAEMLCAEGFTFTGELDLLDAGPRLAAPRTNIRTLQRAECHTVAEIAPTVVAGSPGLLANSSLDFRATLCSPGWTPSGDLALTPEIASALRLQKGDAAWYVEEERGEEHE